MICYFPTARALYFCNLCRHQKCPCPATPSVNNVNILNEQSMSIPRRGGGQVPNRRLSLATLHCTGTATDACLPVLLGRPCLMSDNSVGGRVAHGSLPTLAHCRHCYLMKWNRLTGRIQNMSSFLSLIRDQVRCTVSLLP